MAPDNRLVKPHPAGVSGLIPAPATPPAMVPDRYYERAGIVPRAARTASGGRRYSDEDIARLRFVRRCRDLGFTIADIRTLLGLAEDNEPPLASTKILGERHLERIRRKMGELRELEHAITELIEHRDVARAPFPLLDRLFTEGASPARK